MQIYTDRIKEAIVSPSCSANVDITWLVKPEAETGDISKILPRHVQAFSVQLWFSLSVSLEFFSCYLLCHLLEPLQGSAQQDLVIKRNAVSLTAVAVTTSSLPEDWNPPTLHKSYCWLSTMIWTLSTISNTWKFSPNEWTRMAALRSGRFSSVIITPAITWWRTCILLDTKLQTTPWLIKSQLRTGCTLTTLNGPMK